MFIKNIPAYGRNLAFMAGVALLAAGALPQLKASDLDKEVRMTFSASVEIPGKVLSPGTYLLRTDSINPRVIRVMNREGNRLIGITMTLPTYKNDARPAFGAGGGDAVSTIPVTFQERPANVQGALGSWNYPGDPTGFELVYPAGAR